MARSPSPEDLKWQTVLHARDEAGFGELVVPLLRRNEIDRWILRWTREDVADRVQCVLLAAWINGPQYDPTRASYRTWLYNIAKHHIIDHRRRTSARKRINAVPSPDFNPETLASPKQMRDRHFDELKKAAFQEAQRKLSGKPKEAWRAYCEHWQEFDEREITAATLGAPLGMDANAFKVNLHRARDFICAWLQQRGYFVDKLNACLEKRVKKDDQ